MAALRVIVLAPTKSIGWAEAATWGVYPVAIVTPLSPHGARGVIADRIACTFGLTPEQRDTLMPHALPSLRSTTRTTAST